MNKVFLKRGIFLFGIILAIVFVIIGCRDKAEVGMNELTLKQLEKKLDNHETFLLLTFAEKEKDVKKTEFIEAWDDSLRRAGLTGFYVNLQGEDEKTIKDLEETYKHPESDEWDAINEGLVLVEKGGVQTEYGGGGKSLVEKRAKEGVSFLEKDEIKEIDSGVESILEYIKFYNIKFTD